MNRVNKGKEELNKQASELIKYDGKFKIDVKYELKQVYLSERFGFTDNILPWNKFSKSGYFN